MPKFTVTIRKDIGEIAKRLELIGATMRSGHPPTEWFKTAKDSFPADRHCYIILEINKGVITVALSKLRNHSGRSYDDGIKTCCRATGSKALEFVNLLEGLKEHLLPWRVYIGSSGLGSKESKALIKKLRAEGFTLRGNPIGPKSQWLAVYPDKSFSFLIKENTTSSATPVPIELAKAWALGIKPSFEEIVRKKQEEMLALI